MRNVTVRLGFNNVIDAFHRLGPTDLERRFFIDERATSKSIRLTDELRLLGEGRQAGDLTLENEARWRLVETAWELGISRSLIEFDPADKDLEVRRRGGRITVPACRAALNGYQKGNCFYCFGPIGIAPGAPSDVGADVDHFFPWILGPGLHANIDGVWNLVLACPACNRGSGGKSDRIPEFELLERLYRRNEFLIASHHPLQETLIDQTGRTSVARVGFLNQRYELAVQLRVSRWRPVQRAAPAF